MVGNSLVQVRLLRSVAYSVELELLNKHQMWGGAPKLDCYLVVSWPPFLRKVADGLGELSATVTAPDHSEVPTKVARHDTIYDVSFMPCVTGRWIPLWKQVFVHLPVFVGTQDGAGTCSREGPYSSEGLCFPKGLWSSEGPWLPLRDPGPLRDPASLGDPGPLRDPASLRALRSGKWFGNSFGRSSTFYFLCVFILIYSFFSVLRSKMFACDTGNVVSVI